MLRVNRYPAKNCEPVHSCGERLRIVRQPSAIFLFGVEVWRLVGEVAQAPATDAVISLGRLLEMHPAHSAAKWTAFLEFEIRPFPDAEIFRDGVPIMANDFECVGVSRDEAIAASAHEIFQDFTWFETE